MKTYTKKITALTIMLTLITGCLIAFAACGKKNETNETDTSSASAYQAFDVLTAYRSYLDNSSFKWNTLQSAPDTMKTIAYYNNIEGDRAVDEEIRRLARDMDEELKTKIKTGYLQGMEAMGYEGTLDDVVITKCYGTFDGKVAFMAEIPAYTEQGEWGIGFSDEKIEIRYSDNNAIFIYVPDKISKQAQTEPQDYVCNIIRAVNQKLLTSEELKEIADKQNRSIEFDGYQAQPKDPAELDDETAAEIKLAYAEKMSTSGKKVAAKDVTILKYCGTYGGCVAAMLTYADANYSEEGSTLSLFGSYSSPAEDVTFRYEDGNELCIFIPKKAIEEMKEWEKSIVNYE